MKVTIKKGYPRTPWAFLRLPNHKVTMIDEDRYENLNRFTWHLKKSFQCWYVVRKIRLSHRTFYVRLHRIVAGTPPHLVCHHQNHNTLDNRDANLLNMTWYEHGKMYSYR